MAYCPNCGTQQPEGQRFCGVCGKAQPSPSALAPMPAMSEAAAKARYGEARVLLGLSLDPPRQSRWTVLLRIILLIPLGLVAIGIEIAAFFVVVAAWFAALFTGRVPDGIQRFLTNALRFYANVMAYAYLLTNRWPGIVWSGEPDDQVTIDVDHVSLRRWAVFFRLVLAIPASIVSEALGIGVYPVIVVMWFWGVIAGREPRMLHQAVSLILRYQMRLIAYASLLTPTQPFQGFLGDGVEEPPSGSGPTDLTPTGTALPTRWFVAKSARVVVIVVLAMSVPLYFVSASINNPLVSRLRGVFARVQVTAVYNSTVSAVNQFEASVSACPASGEPACAANAAATADPVLNQQLSLMSNTILFPADSLVREVRFDSTLIELQSEMFQIQSATSAQAQSNVLTVRLPATFATFQNDYRSLDQRLGG